MAIEVHVGDIGTDIEITIKDEYGAVLDISGATETTLKMKSVETDGATVENTMSFKTDGTDGILVYTTDGTEFDVAGKWEMQIFIAMPSWEGHTAKIPIQIYDNL